MTFKQKIILGIIVVLTIVILLFIIKEQRDTINKLELIEKSIIESKDIGNGIIRAQSSYVTKEDIKVLIKERELDLAKIKKDLELYSAEIKGLNVISASSYGGFYNLPSDKVIKNENKLEENEKEKIIKQLELIHFLNLNEKFNNTNIPFGNVKFDISKEHPWLLEVFKRDYFITTVIATDENERIYSYNKFSLKVNGKNYIIPINSSIKQVITEPKFRFSNHLFFSLDTGVTSKPDIGIMPNLSISFFSYGKDKFKSDWTFGHIGIGYEIQNKNISFLLSPINYNIEKYLPAIENLYLGPSFVIDSDSNFGVFIGAKFKL